MPGLYPGRTRHIHVRLQAPDGPSPVTQLSFPGVSENATDGLFDPALLVEIEPTDEAAPLLARFDFLVE